MDAEKAFERFESMLRDWLRDSGGTRIDIDYHAIHRTGFITNWLTINGQRKGILLPAKINFARTDLHESQVDPHQGAWTYSHLWMEASDGVLHQESDWMCEPDMGTGGFYVGPDGLDIRDGGPDLGEYKTELDRYPRDQDFIPDWLRDKVERWRLERGSVVARRIVELREESRLEREECL